MSVFNSLGSNYTLGFTWRAFLTPSRKRYCQVLADRLSREYSGKAQLTYKGREALTLALRAARLPKGSQVAVNGYTCWAVYDAIRAAGFTPVYLDIGRDNLNFDSSNLEAAARKAKRLRAVIIQNTLGMPCDIAAIQKVCQRHNLVLIEDLAHSAGLVYTGGQTAGSVGDFTVLSFSQDKLIDAVSGGALIIRRRGVRLPAGRRRRISWRRQLKDRLYPDFTFTIRATHWLGIGKVYLWLLKHLNLLSRPMDGNAATPHRLPGWQAALAAYRLDNLMASIKHRQAIARIYERHLPASIRLPASPNGVYLRFPIRVTERRKLIDYLKKHHIHVADIWYDAPVSPGKYMDKTNYRGQCPQAEKLSREMLNLPTHQAISEQKALAITEAVTTWLKLPSV